MKQRRARPALCFLSLVSLALCASGDTLHAPGDHPTIQAAIVAANNGDEIVVAPGTYAEAIDLLGKLLTVRSSGGASVTTLDGTGLGDVSLITCEGGETLATTVQGFTICDGRGTVVPPILPPDGCFGVAGRHGGGLLVRDDSGVTVADCVFDDNGIGAFLGGAVSVIAGGELVAVNTVFRDNGSGAGGGGIRAMPTRQPKIA